MTLSRTLQNKERQHSAAAHQVSRKRPADKLNPVQAKQQPLLSAQFNLQEAITNSPRMLQYKSYQAMADNAAYLHAPLQKVGRERYDILTIGNTETNTNPVAQLASKYQVGNAIGFAESPAAAAKQEIIDDLSATTGGKEIDFSESNGTPWIQAKVEVKTAARTKGYSEEAATRLIEKNPYEKKDIKGKSTIIKDTGAVTSFYGVTADFIGPQAHQLFFSNTYKEGKWVMEDNFRNPFLATFFGNDVIETQKALVTEKGTKPPGELRILTRTNIVSKTGVKWAKDNSVTNGELTDELLTSFLKTENGEHSKKIAKDQGVNIVGGTVSNIITDGGTPYKYFQVELKCTPIVVAL